MIRPLTRTLLTLALTVISLALVVSTAAAHRAQVVEAGATEIDLGRDPGAQLIHATLKAPGDALAARLVVPATGSFAIDVLVPDQPQERHAKPTIQLGSCGAGAAGAEAAQRGVCAGVGIGLRADHHAAGGVLTDRATHIRYRRIDRITRADGLAPGRVISIRIVRGATPMRVALRTDDGSPFRLEQASKVPRTVARIGGWAAQPAAGSPRATGDSGDGYRSLVWLPFSFAGVVVLIAIWWMLRGRGAARRRGVERSEAERRPRPPRS